MKRRRRTYAQRRRRKATAIDGFMAGFLVGLLTRDFLLPLLPQVPAKPRKPGKLLSFLKSKGKARKDG